MSLGFCSLQAMAWRSVERICWCGAAGDDDPLPHGGNCFCRSALELSLGVGYYCFSPLLRHRFDNMPPPLVHLHAVCSLRSRLSSASGSLCLCCCLMQYAAGRQVPSDFTLDDEILNGTTKLGEAQIQTLVPKGGGLCFGSVRLIGPHGIYSYRATVRRGPARSLAARRAVSITIRGSTTTCTNRTSAAGFAGLRVNPRGAPDHVSCRLLRGDGSSGLLP